MSGVNRVHIIGRLGKSPETINTTSGKKVSRFPVATSEVWKDKNGQKKEQTEWHLVQVWAGLADVAEKYLNKGDMVYIEGKLRTRSWEKDGITRYQTEIVGDNMTMLSTKGSSAETPVAEVVQNEEGDNDLPF
ncbi:MAG TPA: single-stranded DNA-binding protein [Bacteroidia bacterium]|nr:single-stranded DNA-binding protein [Bacteroidia bacterium]